MHCISSKVELLACCTKILCRCVIDEEGVSIFEEVQVLAQGAYRHPATEFAVHEASSICSQILIRRAQTVWLAF